MNRLRTWSIIDDSCIMNSSKPEPEPSTEVTLIATTYDTQLLIVSYKENCNNSTRVCNPTKVLICSKNSGMCECVNGE